MSRGIYECINCGHREILDSSEPLLEKACPRCGRDMVLVGFYTESQELTVQVQPSRPSLPENLKEKLKEFYNLELKQIDGNVFVFEVQGIMENNFERVLRELEELGYWAALKKREGKVLLFVFPAQEIKEDNRWLPWIFLIATIFTTFLAGYYLSLAYIDTLNYYGLPGIRNPYLNAIAFSISVMAILGTHELGHKIAAAYHGVRATMPYFIPFPSMLGTLGAVIRVKSPLPTRNAAIDLGISGPIAGFLIALPVSIIGLRLSIPVPAELVSPTEGSIVFGENLIFLLLEKYIVTFPEDTVIFLHPVAIAGWVGILVTFLNLIPAAQLDGGHIARAFLSEKTHRYLTIAVGLVLIGMSFLWVGWLIWGMLVLLMGSVGNPGALDEVSSISKKRLVLVILAVMIFLISATPRPLWVTG
ncbi:membrane-associated metallopeptidase [Thermococcus onnurineus NA1]|uniref:Membrane-associated metallopeptidase n=1 Tax=Thermococcus onnurineus (strain NA1) TaxID=523850 RepID=B6YU57_THEON|nr:site-2 protease family protein [Thermococcus onnurineus]ACJ15999.1 membrane-associated metallopeptidase [Thermococcus onnurineus NA1]